MDTWTQTLVLILYCLPPTPCNSCMRPLHTLLSISLHSVNLWDLVRTQSTDSRPIHCFVIRISFSFFSYIHRTIFFGSVKIHLIWSTLCQTTCTGVQVLAINLHPYEENYVVLPTYSEYWYCQGMDGCFTNDVEETTGIVECNSHLPCRVATSLYTS